MLITQIKFDIDGKEYELGIERGVFSKKYNLGKKIDDSPIMYHLPIKEISNSTLTEDLKCYYSYIKYLLRKKRRKGKRKEVLEHDKKSDFDLIKIVADGVQTQKDEKEIQKELAKEIQEKLKQLSDDEFMKAVKEVSVFPKDTSYLVLLEISSNKQQEELSDQDLHCITRLLQSTIFADSIFYGCQYCKYYNSCFPDGTMKNNDMHYDKIMKKLQDITGIDTSPGYNRNNLEAKFKKYQL